MTNILSIGSPSGPTASSCGYCSPPGSRSSTASSRLTASFGAMQLSCEVYQKMIDRGWRRSGTYCYKPNLKTSCCPQYTIKLDALAFKASKSQRKLVNRWNRFILHGVSEDSMHDDTKPPKNVNLKSKSKNPPEFSLSSSIHASESGFIKEENPAHQFETVLEPSGYSKEKFALFQKYQEEIHHDTANTPSGFKRFLVESPLHEEPIPYPSPPPKHLPINYGSYHQLYRLDGQLVAMAVLDILPNCVSSVYFMYDKTWENFSLGKLSALREISLSREMHEAGVPQLSSLYMGFYIYSCQKMRYKGDYSPSYLADPESFAWFPLETCVKLLDKHRYACFSQPDHSITGPANAEEERSNLSVPPVSVLKNISMVNSIQGSQVVVEPLNLSRYWEHKRIRQDILSCIHGFGIELSKEIIFGI